MNNAATALIVDDDQHLLPMCRRIVEGMGLTVETAASAAEAEKKLAERRFDIVLSDVRMERADDGVRLAGEVQRLWGGTDVILMTGDPGLDSAVPAVRARVFDYIQKPFRLDDLRRVLDRCLAERRLKKELPVEQSLREELAAAYAELQKVEALKEAILSRVSHELRTPLTIIELCAAVLGEEEATPDGQKMRRRLSAATGRMKEMVEQLLLHSRLSRGVALRRETVDLEALIAGVAGELRPLWEERGISYEYRGGAPAPAASADPGLLRTAVRNLLLNAIRFNKDGGRIEVRIAAEQSEAVVEIADTGVGAPPAQHKLMLDGFYQAADFMTRRVGGMGLGLATARLIAERHGGSIALSGRQGEGCRATLRLPSPAAAAETL